MGLRDRALIGVMVYTFARINAVLQMKVRDYFVKGLRGWVRLHEKGGKEHELPCNHNLECYVDEHIDAAGIATDPDGPLFRATGRKTGAQHPMWQQDAYRMIQRPVFSHSLNGVGENVRTDFCLSHSLRIGSIVELHGYG